MLSVHSAVTAHTEEGLKMHRGVLTAFGLGISLVCPMIQAAVLHVPGDFPDPQTAINAAAAGDIIIIHGGAWTPITIDKPLTLVGDPPPVFEPWPVFTIPTNIQPPLIDIQGPGAGSVVLQGIQTGGSVDASHYIRTGPAVACRGLDALRLYDCVIRAPAWGSLSGLARGAEGIFTSIPHLVLSSCEVTGGRDEDDSCDLQAWQGMAGVRTPSVVVIDSTITGGPGDSACVDSTVGCDVSQAVNGEGGPGIFCDRLFVGGNTWIRGGQGGTILCLGGMVGRFSDGPDLVAGSVIAPPGTINDSGSTALGANWTLRWSNSTTMLIVGTNARAPIEFPAHGWLFFEPANLLLTLPVSFGFPGSVTVTVPTNPALIGFELIVQSFDPWSGLSLPVMRSIRP